MAEHHYLPTLKKGTNLIQPPVAGSWLLVNRREIEALSQGLEINDSARRRAATSLPDVWARPLLFHSAIRPNSDHPLRQDLLEEWRGLLSLIALSDYYKLKIELEPVVIDDRGGRFARALNELRPRPILLEQGKGYDWLDVLLLRVDGVTVGALSPLTLVYTGVRRLPESFPLSEDGRLRQPVDAAEIRHVAQWVQSLIGRLDPLMWADQQRNRDVSVVEDIRTLLGTWLTSLRAKLGLTPTEPLEQPGVEFRLAEPGASGAWPRLHTYAIYRELLRAAEIRSDHRPSDFLLSYTRGARERSVVVITSDLLARDARVWMTLKSKDLGAIEDPQSALGRYFPGDSGDRIERQNLGAENALWIRPEKFFLGDTLLMSPADAPLLAELALVRDPKDRRYILPFRKEILQFFTPEEIIDRLEPRFEQLDGGVRFHFKLPLESPLAASVAIRKDYRSKEPSPGQGSIRRFDPSPAYVFPRYKTPHWRRYFVFTAGKTSAIEPLNAPGASVESVTRKRTDHTIQQLTGDGAYPEAVVVSVEEGKAAGLVLLNKPAEQPGLAGGRDMIIGIDYGTSNTNVYLLPPDALQPHAWTIDLRQHMQPIFEAVGSPSGLLEPLLPIEPVKLPIATNLRVFDPAVVDHMLLDYFVYFSGDVDYRLPDNVYSDIKWQDIGKTQQFIKSLLMLLLLEVVEARAKRFKIIFSFPRAFSESQTKRLEQTWLGAIKEMTIDVHRLLNVDDGSGSDLLKPRFSGVEQEVEAVAAGEFFASRNAEGKYENITIANPMDRASVETTAVCIDVGGGTTDICIWHGNQRVLDASILLAGRQIGSWIRGNSTVRELLFTRDAALALKEVEAKPAMFSARLNEVLKRQEEEITKNLIMHGTHPDVERLRRMLALEFGAIVFYTATLLIAANRIERISGNVARDIASEGVNLHWGGNASKMVRWIDYGKFSDDGVAARTLRAVLRNALADGGFTSPADRVGNKQSPGHKSEVAGGLIVWNNVKQLHSAKRPSAYAAGIDEDMVPVGGNGSVARSDSEMLLMGDGLETNDGTIAYDEAISVSRLFPMPGQTIVRSVSMERLKRFLEIINHVGLRSGLLAEGKQVALTEQLRAHLGRQVRGEFGTMAMLDPVNRVVEPAFIAEIRNLLEVLTHQS
jgi:hypothetical protein